MMEEFLLCCETIEGFHENVLMKQMTLFEKLNRNSWEDLKDHLETECDSIEDEISNSALNQLNEIIDHVDYIIDLLEELEKIEENNDLGQTMDAKFQKIKLEFSRIKSANAKLVSE